MRKLVFSKTTRILHFCFAFFVLLAYLSSDFGENIWIHAVFGIMVLGVILLRFFWFYFGEDAIKPKSFDLNFKSLKSYLLDYFNFKENKIRNPATSFGVIFMWIFAILSILFGLIFIGAKYGSGLFWFLYSMDLDTHLFKELHELFGNLLIVTAGVHVLGVFGESFLKKTEIFKTMFDGKIKTNLNHQDLIPAKNSTILAALTFAILLGGFLYLIYDKNNLFVSSSKVEVDYSKLMPISHSECKECHMFYPPNITNKKSQMIVLDNLSNHFGTDASLDSDIVAKIKTEIENFAPEKTKPNLEGDAKFLAINQSIMSTKLWERKHRDFDDKWFK